MLLVQAILVSYFASKFTENDNRNNTNKIINKNLVPSLGYAILISFILVYLVLNRAVSDKYTYCNGIQLRTICTTAVYRKAVRLQHATLHRIGHILNLVSNDVYKLEFGVVYWNFLWIAPIITVISLIISVIYIGPINLIGFAYITLLTLMQIVAGYIFGRFGNLKSITADKRINLMDQIIRGMRVIKLYVWEKSFSNTSIVLEGKKCGMLVYLDSLRAPLLLFTITVCLFLSLSCTHSVLL